MLDVDVLQLGRTDVQLHLALLGLLLGFLVLGLLEGINDELVVGRLVFRGLQEQGIGTYGLGLLDDHLLIEQFQQLKVDGHLLQLKHLPLLKVFNLDAIERDIQGEHIDTDAVDTHMGAQLQLQLFHSPAQELLLEGTVTDCHNNGYQQYHHCYSHATNYLK